MKKILTFMAFFTLCILFFAINPLSVRAEKKQTDQAFIMTHAKDDIVQIQIRSAKRDMDEYSGSRLDTLIYRLDRVKPLEQEESGIIKREEDYIPISFIYSDGTKDIFFFFKNDDSWYVETDKGDVYKNADFIADFLQLPKFSRQGGEVYTLTTPPELLKIRLELERDFDVLGVDFEFVYYTKHFMEITEGSEEEGIEWARNLLTDNMMRSECAKQLGITVSDEEADNMVEKYVSDVSHADDFMRKYNLIYKEAGISLQESAEKNKEIMRADLIRSRLNEHLIKEFADGNDRVGDNVYNRALEYYQAYLEEVAYPQIEESILNDFEEQLDQTEKLYYEKYAESSEL